MASHASSKAARCAALSRSKISPRTAATCRGAAGELDDCPAPVRLAPHPRDEAAALHPGQLMGQPALLPVQRLADLERPQPVLWHLAELHEHLVFGQRES